MVRCGGLAKNPGNDRDHYLRIYSNYDGHNMFKMMGLAVFCTFQ